MELQGRLEPLKRQGVGVAAVSYDPVAVLADFSARRGITFPLLSDPESLTIKRYGIFNTMVPETNQQDLFHSAIRAADLDRQRASVGSRAGQAIGGP